MALTDSTLVQRAFRTPKLMIQNLVFLAYHTLHPIDADVQYRQVALNSIFAAFIIRLLTLGQMHHSLGVTVSQAERENLMLQGSGTAYLPDAFLLLRVVQNTLETALRTMQLDRHIVEYQLSVNIYRDVNVGEVLEFNIAAFVDPYQPISYTAYLNFEGTGDKTPRVFTISDVPLQINLETCKCELH